MNSVTTIGVIFFAVLGMAVIIFFLWLWKRESQYAYNVLYEDLLSFKYYVEHTPINNISYGNIINRIKIERARDQMTVPEYCNLLHEITHIFTKRFADFIQERGSKNNIPPVSITLYRDDLIEAKANTPYDKISLTDFKSSIVTLDDIRKADQVFLVDGDKVVELKNRYL